MGPQIQIMSLDELMAFLKKEAETGPLTITFPQFDRTDGIHPVQVEGGKFWFDQLKTLPHETLLALGMGLWEIGHYLYPVEWYDFIPDGYMVTSICGVDEPFKHGETDNDRRFGMLSYGFRTHEWKPEDCGPSSVEEART
jgi:hypothetical protein